MFAGLDAQSLVALAVVVLSLLSVPLIAGAGREPGRVLNDGSEGAGLEKGTRQGPRLRRAGSLQA